MGLFSSNDSAKEKKVLSPLCDVIGEHDIYMDCRGSNLFLHDKCVIIDRTQGGLFNLGNRTYKVIPYKNISSVQVKSTGATTGYLEFGTFGNENTGMKGFDRTNDENTVNFAGHEEEVKVIMKYLMEKIL